MNVCNGANIVFLKVNIDTVLKYGNRASFDIYLKLSTRKIVKLNHREDDYSDVLVKYKEKGVRYIYTNKDDFVSFLKTFKNSMDARLDDEAVSPLEKMDLLDKAYSLIKETFVKIGVDNEFVQMALNLNKRSLVAIQHIPSISKYYDNLITKCSCEFIKSMLVAYTASAVTSIFEWQTQAIREKIFFASILRDIGLDKDDFNEQNSACEVSEMSDKVRKHPVTIAEMLSSASQFIGSDVLTVIQQHHESPDGHGFPNKLNFINITFMSAIVIVASRYVDLIVMHKFDATKNGLILDMIEKDYHQGNFKKVVEALKTVLKLNPKAVVSSPHAKRFLSKL